MSRLYPCIRAAKRDFYWTLEEKLTYDCFDFRRSAPASMLLIGIHLEDERPWECARFPAFLPEAPGPIDLATKRLLGKRLRNGADEPPEWKGPWAKLDTIALALGKIDGTLHSFTGSPRWPSSSEKRPGHLLPRRLTARARIRWETAEIELTSRNFSEISQCLHAELTLIFELSRRLSRNCPPFLELFELESTLKPCKMCAAFLFLLKARSQRFRVSYEEDDPGPLAQDTWLDRTGYEKVT